MQAIRMDQVREIDEEEPRQEEWETLKKYNDRMLHDGISPDDNSDPINYQRHAHDLSLIELKEGLTKAVTDRKAQALPLAISIFNRIQDKIVSTTRLGRPQCRACYHIPGVFKHGTHKRTPISEHQIQTSSASGTEEEHASADVDLFEAGASDVGDDGRNQAVRGEEGWEEDPASGREHGSSAVCGWEASG